MAHVYDNLLSETLETLHILLNEKYWDKEKVSSGGDMKMESKIYKDGLKMFRGSCSIHGSVSEISNSIWNGTEDEAKSVDRFLSSFKTVKTFNNNLRIDYCILSFPWPVWQRDVLYVLKREQLSPTKIILYAASIDNFKVPKLKKTVRMTDVIGCVLIEKKKENLCYVTRLIFGNPSGSLPVILTNSLGSNQVEGLLNFAKEKVRKNKKKKLQAKL